MAAFRDCAGVLQRTLDEEKAEGKVNLKAAS
jgi:hypothetical protein